ncbi:3-deoxy-7-phosphoheptulonate synthase [Streptomyces sp. NBC_01387]|uniref:3-deoxy-7-phosphoheptulonate synthase n=1 Tax=unclassified Streptomyces TaxID=2593676 RepID=UPI002024421F|nr:MULTISPECIES: 3-deoxy-7-phosphoheptulonate synthase [unclassified Streptomyces]MCX4553559.1 3-deoxy-7-phosphoheptulonate synthase [Streptomyces sp. NBC_01500]WSC18510.1 3-deoxy-7-phosphoheptulonate synthase [Streptomyces sp. NBC_01766]WSV52551.1 3-deoxy-7-phosphoheptulonate synthase [Streptomyces sp. NBC_01014]
MHTATTAASSTGTSDTGDLRVTDFQRLVPPSALRDELPLGAERVALVRESRREVRDVLTGADDRLLLVVGPCSVHDPAAALEYARLLAAATAPLRGELCVVMRVYFEKPRTTLGWKGLINDPGLDGTHDVQRGLRLARQVLLDVLDTGLPVGCEFLEPTSPQYIADAVTWGAIGARTPESQVHRQLASGVSMPVGFKNATDGDVQSAVDGCRTAAGSHVFFGIDGDGHGSVVSTSGNPDCHVILRGGRGGPNYGPQDVREALALLDAAGMPGRLVVDASHANSGKDHVRQAEVVREIAARVAAGEQGIAGVMLESFLLAGRQEPGPLDTLVHGQSVTDACVGWEETERLLGELAAAVAERRAARG